MTSSAIPCVELMHFAMLCASFFVIIIKLKLAILIKPRMIIFVGEIFNGVTRAVLEYYCQKNYKKSPFACIKKCGVKA